MGKRKVTYSTRDCYHSSGLYQVAVAGSLAVDEHRKYFAFAKTTKSSQSNPEFFDTRKSMPKTLKRYRATGYEPLLKSYNLLRYADIGGSFFISKNDFKAVTPQVTGVGSKGVKAFVVNTPLFCWKEPALTPNSVDWPQQRQEGPEMDYLMSHGAEAIAKTIPTVPQVSLANFFGELKNDGIPSLVPSILRRASSVPDLFKRAGNDYLNFEFGWKPFVSDIIEISKAVRDSEKILSQYERDSGRPVGRRFDFPVEQTTVVTEMGVRPPSPTFDTNCYSGPFSVPVTKVDQTYRRTWFEGLYTYHLPVASDARGKIALYASEAEKLLGLRITPEVLWNLAPWSWLSDWFFNIGSIMTNISAIGKDDCLLRRGYIMSHSWNTVTYSCPGVSVLSHGPTGTLSQTYSSESKSRRRATPWGFGVTFSDFTPRQIAIMSALGVSRDWKMGIRS